MNYNIGIKEKIRKCAGMTYFNMLQKIIEENDGLVFTKDIVASGIPRSYLSELVKKGELARLEQGVYLTDDAFEDKMYTLQRRKTSIIFSHDTALFSHDLSDRDPLTYSVTVPVGYNTKNIKNGGITVFSIKKELYDLGLTTLTTPFGRRIKVYNMERTICDMLRNRNQMDVAILADALKRYVKRKDKNIPQLMKYAESFRVTKLIRNYLEVLL